LLVRSIAVTIGLVPTLLADPVRFGRLRRTRREWRYDTVIFAHA